MIPTHDPRWKVAAGVLHWTEGKQTYNEESPQWDATAPNGFRYIIKPWLGDSFEVEVFKKQDRYRTWADARLTKDGIEQRHGKRTELPSLEVAKEAAEKHYAAATAPKETDPKVVADKLTPAQRALVLEAFDSGGQLEPDWGTRSERPLRQLRTRLLKLLEPMDVFSGSRLTQLGTEVAKLLKSQGS